MATLALFAGKINNMPGLIKDVRKSVEKYNKELSGLYQKTLKVDGSVCDLGEVMDSLRASSQTQEQRIEILENFQNNSEDFIQDTIRIDNNVADTVDQNKDDFYDKYDYLKPDCEKSGWEKFCDACTAVGEWCKEHWKLIVTIVIVVVAVVLLCTGVGGILGAAALGALMGAAIGGISGGLESMANGGSFLEGFEDGAFSGAISGAVMGGAMAGLGQLGATLGHGIKCASALGKTIKVTAAVTKTISTVMGGFDTLAMMDKTFGIFGGNLADFNAQLHESALYNTFQIGVTALAVFTNGMTSTMSCFVAGTLVLTACGLVAIENIKAGDKVISTDPDTGVTEEKTVLEAFRRTVTELVHLTIGGEVITTTHEHPFYVAGKGFVNAGKLRTKDILLDSKQNKLTIDDISFETSEVPTTVYNFKVSEFHTYCVGHINVLVHNADYGSRPVLPEFDGKRTEGVMVTPDGEQISFSSGNSTSPSYPQYKAQSASHVEGKAALYMRENGIKEATIFHNNPNGTCGFCDRQISALLPEGAKLNVVPPTNAVANNNMAIPVPRTYIGNSTIPKIKF